MLETQGIGILLLLSIVGLTDAQLGRSCNDPSVCQNGATECFHRPLSPTEADTEANYVCDCSSSQKIGFACEVFGPMHRMDMPEESFQTCYGNGCRTGTFKSVNYPSHYEDRWHAIYLLYIPGATRISFTFEGEGGFGVESFKDELYVGTGLTFSYEDFTGTSITTGDREVRFFDNTTLLGRTYPSPFDFESDTAWFYFQTSKNTEWNGWCITWQSDVDITPPFLIDCPLNIERTLERGQPQVLSVKWNEPRGNDPSQPVTNVSTHNPGDIFSLGTTTVTYTFRDRFENQAICSFDVTIIEADTIPPVISNCPGDISRKVELGTTEVSVTWIEPNATDVDPVILTYRSHAPGAYFPAPSTTTTEISPTTVLYIFSDGNGNAAACSFTVLISAVDRIPPTIMDCPSDIFDTVKVGPNEIVSVVWIEPTATDISGTERLQMRSHAPGFGFQVGPTTVTYEFVDASGNSATCIFSVIIKGVYPPVLNASLKVKKFYEVNVGGSLSIPCRADNATSYKWEMTAPKKRHINTSQNLTIESATFEDQGIYICLALGKKGYDVSEPQVVVVKGYLHFLVKFDSFGRDLSTRISDELEDQEFEFSDLKNGDQQLDVYKLLNGTTALQAYYLLNKTLENVSAANWTYSITKTGYCPFEKTNTENGRLTFPATLVGVIAHSFEVSLTSTSVARATRRCNGNYTDAAIWDHPVITNIKDDAKENITKSITNLVYNIAYYGVSKENASYVADVLKNVTEAGQLETPHIDKVVYVLHDVVLTNDTSEKVTISILSTVNNLVVTSESNETEGRLSPNTSVSLLQAFEQQIDNVRDSGQIFNFTSTTIEVYIVKVVDVNVWVIYRTYFVGEEDIRSVSLNTEIYEVESDYGSGGNTGKGGEDDNGKGSGEGYNEESDQTNNDGTDQPDVVYDEGEGGQEKNATVIELDRPAIEGLRNNSDAFPISFVLHRRSALFNGGHEDGTKINTLIVSASVDRDIKNLPDESNIITSFHPIERHRCAKPSCVFWDPSLNDGIGGWSPDGCHYVESQHEEQYTCHCNNLTNVAVLLDLKGDTENKILDYLTIVGCVVSVLCIVLTMFFYLGIKKLRTSLPQQIVLNICFALLGLYISFLAGIDQAHNYIPCVIFGALIHFFTLAAMTWMSVEAMNMYLLFVKIFNAQMNYFMIKASLISWGIPAVIVLISAVLSPDSYSNCKYCFPDSTSIVFYAGVLGVIALLITFNLVIFVLVTRKLTCARAKMSNRTVSRQEIFRRLQNAVAISVLLVVTWVTGVLSIGAVSWLLNFLFCLANSFQGCSIFFLFCVRQQEVRSVWMEWLRLSVSRASPTSTSATSGTDGVSKSKGTSGEKSTSGVNSKGKMELSNVKNVSEVSVAKDPLSDYAEADDTSYD